ncbi:hypothetical protein BC829DRAFT_381499 [Chytridium lagenaria]|nr:hypothetical protein BC829DRAFT_381499 [Chytridium lagenaria]
MYQYTRDNHIAFYVLDDEEGKKVGAFAFPEIRAVENWIGVTELLARNLSAEDG